ncbi:MAG: EAL domain-containing protein, partial [Rhodoplanes sp.]|nr:EAL domain-containing protein [Rhodoplanes sp.]
MARLGAIFVGLCMALIAGSVGALMYLYLGTSGAESAVVALVAFTGLAVYNAASLRQRERTDASGPIADLSRGTADLARQVIDLGRRVATMESRLDGVLDRVGEAAKPLSDEISELGTLLTHLAETVTTHDTLLRSGAPGSPYTAPRQGDSPAAAPVTASPAVAPTVPAAVPAPVASSVAAAPA